MRSYNISSAVHKIFGLQALFKSTLLPSYPVFRTVSSLSPIDPDINRTVSYWFDGEEPAQRWFDGGLTVDAEIKDQFGGLVEKARAAKLNSWTEHPKGTLALLLLLDQFPRNLYRGSALSFSSDATAFKIATEAIAKGFDQQVPHLQQPFFYLPLMHDESLISQIAALALFESLLARCDPNSEVAKFFAASMHFAKKHQHCILHFGRFPSRNEILGRQSTPEEIEYLKEHPSGF